MTPDLMLSHSISAAAGLLIGLGAARLLHTLSRKRRKPLGAPPMPPALPGIPDDIARNNRRRYDFTHTLLLGESTQRDDKPSFLG